jgi:hypothetical protein
MSASSRLAIATQGFRGGSGEGGSSVSPDITATITEATLSATITESALSATITEPTLTATVTIEELPANIPTDTVTGEVSC